MSSYTKKGFTLLEILLVIALLAILFTTVLYVLNPSNIIAEINDNKRQADALNLYQALEQYALKTGSYPTSIQNISVGTSLEICKTGAPSCTAKVDLSSVLVPDYIASIPSYSTDTINSGYYLVKDNNNKIGIGGIKSADNTKFISGLTIQTFNDPIVTNGLALYLDAGNTASYPGTGTTWTDLSGNGNNGTLVNGVGYNSANGGSLVFDGVDDWVDVSSPNLTSSNYTVIAVSRFISTIRVGLLAGRTISSKNNNWLVGQYGYPAGNSGVNGAYYAEGWLNGVSLPIDTNWRIYAATGHILNDIYELYVNGVVLDSGNGGSAGPNGFALGRGSSAFNEYSNSEIGFILVYNRVLSPSEIQQNYNALRGRYGL